MRGTSCLLVRIGLLVSIGLTGCDERGGAGPVSEQSRPPVPAVGDYSLTAVGGRMLPIDLGPLPTRDGTPSSCTFLWDVGALTLTAVGFELSYEHHSSCGGAALSRTYVAGIYARVGHDSLVLNDGSGARHSGRVYGDSLRVQFYEYQLMFRRAAAR